VTARYALLCTTFGLVATIAHPDSAPSCPRTDALLREGKETVRIVGFGDSITGIYYHTGGRRAWPEMLGIALQRIYPQAKIEITNAGISGNSSGAGLARIDADVLAHKPHLVAVMFGMNDAGGSMDALRDNLTQIVERCRGAGAEVVLMTPNSIYPEHMSPDDSARSVAALEEVVAVVRKVAADLRVPLADCYAAYEAVRARDPMEWTLLMSETIHPNMNGHKLFAELVAEVVTGRRVSVADVPPEEPGIPKTLSLLSKGEPVRVIAMEPYDTMIGPALQQLDPKAQVEVTPWPVPRRSLDKIRDWSRGVRAQQPDLVVIAVPAAASARDQGQFIRTYAWVLNWAASFGVQEWDCVAILPSVLKPDLTVAERKREGLARKVIWGQHIPMIERRDDDTSPAQQILSRWLREQAAASCAARP
jgi:lysophospholipase L1-like esterase